MNSRTPTLILLVVARLEIRSGSARSTPIQRHPQLSFTKQNQEFLCRRSNGLLMVNRRFWSRPV